MKATIVALAVLVLPADAARAENWVRAGIANVGAANEETIYVDVDSIFHHFEYVRFRARWVNHNFLTIREGPILESVVVQDVDCRSGARFMLAREDYDHGGRLIRNWRAPAGRPEPTANRPGAAGHVAARFVCDGPVIS